MTATGFAPVTPITTSLTGGNTTLTWNGPPPAVLPTPVPEVEVKALTGPPPDDVRDGVMLALHPDPATAAALTVPGGTTAEQIHLTVAYIGKTDTVTVPELIRAASSCLARAPITGQISGHARFTGGDRDVIVALYDSPGLERLRRDVVDALAAAGLELPGPHGYTPHLTLGYLEVTDAAPLLRIEPRPVTFDRLSVVHGTTRADLPFLGDALTEPEADGHAAAEDTGRAEPDGGWMDVKTGAFVDVDGRKGRVDLLVHAGTVPGATGPDGSEITGTTDNPAARVTTYGPTGTGTYAPTGERIAIPVRDLRRIAPLRTREAKSLDEALAWAVHAHDDGDPTATLDPQALRAVYQRGVKSWPGAERTALTAHQWALGRVDAFTATAAGLRPAGYNADDDLLPA